MQAQKLVFVVEFELNFPLPHVFGLRRLQSNDIAIGDDITL